MTADAPIEVPDPGAGVPRPVLVRDLVGIRAGDVDQVGGKAANLGELLHVGLPVPPGFVVTTAAYRRYVADHDLQHRLLPLVPAADADERAHEDAARRIAALFTAPPPEELAAAVTGAYQALGRPAVAVRSSATAEDSADASFAGQQDSYLNVSGDEAVLAAVRRCWASLWTARALAYRSRRGIDPRELALAVVVQTLVDADASGVLVTADPTTGRRDTVVVNAAWGLGEAVVGGLVDPDQLTLVGDDLAVADRRIADKRVQTVRTSAGTEEVPVPDERRSAAVLDDATARRLAVLGRRAAAHAGVPQDVEWVRRRDGELLLVQSRPITALPEPTGPVPTDWAVPDPHASYFRASIVEQLPDPLTPLFAELIDPAVTSSLTTLMAQVLGTDTLRPGDVGLPTVNGYAYYRYGNAAMTRMLRDTLPALRGAYGRRGFGGRERWETVARPAYAAAVDAWRGREPAGLPVRELLDGVVALLDAAAVYYTSVQTIIPVAAASEIALTRYYDAFVRRDGDPPAAGLLLGLDSEPLRAERSLWDLGRWVREDEALTAWLEATPAAEVVAALGLAPPSVTEAGTEPDPPPPPAAAAFAARLSAHLDSFGHTVYNLDFSHPVPADDPTPLVDTLRLAVRGQIGDPYERQRRLQQKRDAATVVIRRRIDPVRRGQLDWLLRRAQAIAPVREDALADVGLAWPQLRRMLAELGRRLVAAGVVDRVDDVYWCRRAEIEAALAGDSRDELRPVLAERRAVWRGQRLATPPQILPEGTWLDRLGALMPAATAAPTGDVLRGTGASSGRVTAVARVLAGPEDFARLQPGEVLVAAITTPAWTSLFARAAAVVTDIGGPLSHSSIVAREYGIPAVLGTGVGTRRIVDGQRVSVDGDAGTVHLAEEAGTLSPSPAHRRLNRWLIAGGTAAAVAGGAAAAVLRGRRGQTRT